VEKSIRELKPDYSGTLDHADEVHHECPHCGSFVWNVKASFEDYELSFYFLDMECAVCGTFAKAPTLVDKP
jgi:ribosomal protein L37E